MTLSKTLPGLLVFMVFVQLGTAQNLTVNDIAMDDPYVGVFNDKIYLYTGA